MQLSAGGKIFSWKFLQADVAFPIIGADFLANFKMAVDLSGRQLLCPAGLKIPLEAPSCGGHMSGGGHLITFTSHSGGTWREEQQRPRKKIVWHWKWSS